MLFPFQLPTALAMGMMRTVTRSCSSLSLFSLIRYASLPRPAPTFSAFVNSWLHALRTAGSNTSCGGNTRYAV